MLMLLNALIGAIASQGMPVTYMAQFGVKALPIAATQWPRIFREATVGPDRTPDACNSLPGSGRSNCGNGPFVSRRSD
jgi:hypothetical protein